MDMCYYGGKTDEFNINLTSDIFYFDLIALYPPYKNLIGVENNE